MSVLLNNCHSNLLKICLHGAFARPIVGAIDFRRVAWRDMAIPITTPKSH